MKLMQLYNKLGKQLMKTLNKQDANVYIDGNKYVITNIHYDNGKAIGFDAKPVEEWFSEMIKPEEERMVIVRDEEGKEHPDHTWNGMRWYAWVNEDGWPSDVDVISWKYQD